MGFVQIIEFHTSKIAEVQEVGNAWEKATEGKRKAGRSVMCEDRDNPGRYLLGVNRGDGMQILGEQWQGLLGRGNQLPACLEGGFGQTRIHLKTREIRGDVEASGPAEPSWICRTISVPR